LVEKPLTPDARTAEQLVTLAQAKRKTLQVGHVERFNPAWQETIGQLGPVRYVQATRASRFPGRCLDVGVVLDLMIHDLDLVLSLTSAALVDVQATGRAVVTQHEDLAEARLTFADGLVANLRASRISPQPQRSMQLFGDQAFADLDFGKPAAALIRPNASILSRSFQLGTTVSLSEFKEQIFERWLPQQTNVLEPRNAILDELHDFVVACSTGAKPLVTGDAGARAVQAAELVLQRIAASQQINMPAERPFEAPSRRAA